MGIREKCVGVYGVMLPLLGLMGCDRGHGPDQDGGSSRQRKGSTSVDVRAAEGEVPTVEGQPSETTKEQGPYENPFLPTHSKSLSTFSTDVDTASFSLARQSITSGSLPKSIDVRTEEFINYFAYSYPQPAEGKKVSVSTDVFSAPWNHEHQLIRVGIKAFTPVDADKKAMNLVFLVDTSGSMYGNDRLELVKKSLQMLVENLREDDRVGIVTYAGVAQVVLKSTSGSDKAAILQAIINLDIGGSTNGEAGIVDAYKIAREGYIEGGVNRVILATDGDFNVGVSSDEGLVKLIEEKAKTGVYLTILGYGAGNYRDAKMEKLSNNGNGNYAYIDNESEAARIFRSRGLATLMTVAKDTKIQIEFNPRLIEKYRLIGYENRMLKEEEFNNDQRDAGDMGAGHAVTALYEVVPRTGSVALEPLTLAAGVDPLVYRDGSQLLERANSDEMMNIKVRYKDPEGSVSQMIEQSAKESSEDDESELRRDSKFCAAVAGFAMVLRGSKLIGDAALADIIAWLDEAQVEAAADYKRKEFKELVQKAIEIRR